MKNLILNILSLLIMMTAMVVEIKAQTMKTEKGIEFFEGTLEELLAHAKQTDKAIFIDAYTPWCGPCKVMEKKVFVLPEVSDFYNNFYISYKLNMESSEGVQFAKQHDVNVYPTYLYLNANGEEKKRAIGARQPNKFVAEAREALIDEEKMAAMGVEYLEGRSDQAFLASYMEQLWVADEAQYEEVAMTYFNTLSTTDLNNGSNLELVYALANDITMKGFEVFADNSPLFAEKFGEKSVADKMVVAAFNSLDAAIGNNDYPLFDQIINTIQSSGSDKTQAYTYRASLKFYEGMGEWKKYTSVADDMLANTEMDKSESAYINNIAWNVYENAGDKNMLKKAVKWTKQSIELQSTYYNNDTLASLYYKMGQYDNAKEAAQNAVNIAEARGMSAKGAKKMLIKIEMKTSK
ncbi:MAG: thioredoxin family protein [Chitinophagales bacterium]